MGPAFSRKYNTLTVTGTTAIRIPIIKRGVVDFAVGADWTPAGGDVKIAIDGAAPANVTNLPTAVASGNGAYWEFILTAAELTCKSSIVTIVDAATKAVEDQAFVVETYGNASAMYQADLSAANLPVNVIQVNGTSQTARDIGASVLLSAGSGAGQLDFTSGVVKANLAQILATALTETAGQLAGGFKKFFNIGTPASTMDALTSIVTVSGNVGGNVTGSVGSVAAGGIASSSFAANAVDAAALASDAATEIGNATLTAAASAPIASNTKQINGTTVNGNGGGVPWGP